MVLVTLPGRPPDRRWFEHPTLAVAQNLLGAYLLTVSADGALVGGRIVETEAYLNDDPASHSYRGATERNGAMFGPPGRAYVYRIYGIHTCVNVVTAPAGTGEAVLIRALEPLWGADTMALRRGTDRNVTNGPGRLCAALAISRNDDGTDLAGSGSIHLRLAETTDPFPIVATRRIGLSVGVKRYWRFVDAGSSCLSRSLTRR